MSDPVDRLAATLVRRLTERGESVATAESLTGGLVCAALTSVPGASQAVRGGVVAYAVSVKESVLGVPAGVLREQGAVSRECAVAMAVGGCATTGADWCLSTTGVAGPDPSEGRPVGTVHLALAAGEQAVAHQVLTCHGSREQIRDQTVTAALELLLDTLDARLSDARGTVDADRGTRTDRRRDDDGTATT